MKHSTATAAVAVVTAMAAASITEASVDGMGWPLRFALAVLLGVGIAAMIRAGLVQPLSDAVVAQRRVGAAAVGELEERDGLDQLLDQVAALLEAASDDADVLDVCARGVSRILPDRESSLLLCNANRELHLAFRCEIRPDGLAAPSQMPARSSCLALSGRGPKTVSSTTALDACDHSELSGLEVSAMCLVIEGPHAPIGVISSVGAEGDIPSKAVLSTLGHLVTLVELRLARLEIRRRLGVSPTGGSGGVETDSLTGLPSAHLGALALNDLLAQTAPFSVALCNLDRLAAYNDEHGREMGDVAIQLVGRVLRDALRPDDIVCRMEGDTFLIAFPDCTTTNAAAAMERVREALVLRLAEHGSPRFTCSVGLADSGHGESIDEILDAADLAMSMAKYDGGNRVRAAWVDDAMEADPRGPASID